jgi:predicted RNase H-like HicB family nuclease
MTRGEYPIVIEVLSPKDGGGFVATVPDLPGCMSDGETREEATRSIADAIDAWIEEATRMGRPIPDPLAQSWPRC